MTVALGVMSVPAPVDGDSIRRYETGTLPDGGLWTALRRLSDHDHTGGELGTPISVASLPDGSISVDKLDPAVLLPYSLVDGSKPFTGQVTMQADAIVRDALYFGQQGTALAPDVTLARTAPGGLRVDTNLGQAVNPQAWGNQWAAHQVVNGALFANTAGTQFNLSHNTWFDNTTFRAIAAAGATRVIMDDQFRVYTAPSVAAGGTQTFISRAQIAPTGTLTLTPDAGVAALSWGVGYLQPGYGTAGSTLLSTGDILQIQASGNYVRPVNDGAINLGHPSARWGTVFAATGTISTSSAAVKEGITPLSPTECYEAAKAVRWFDFRYAPPAYTAPEPPPAIAYDAADDNETKAEKKALRDEAEEQAEAAYARMLVETAPARHQRGFVFPSGDAKDEAGGTLPPVPDLFGLSDRESTTPQADLATLGAALQEVIRRLELLEGAPA